MTEDVLTMFTIYLSPMDYPGQFVVREFAIRAGQQPAPAAEPLCVVDTLEEARASIPRGMYPLGRDPGDHESVVETWV